MKYLLASLMLMSSSAFAQTDFQSLVNIRESYEIVQSMGERDLMDEADCTSLKQELMQKAQKIDPEIKSFEDLRWETQGFSERVGGFFTFTNILLVTACLMFTLAVIWLFGLYMLTILLAVPIGVYEFGCYAICGWAILAGAQVSPSFTMATVLPGCLGLIGCLSFSHKRHVDESDRNFKEEKYISIYSSILFFVWGAVAIYYDSSIIGFMSVSAFMTAVGFICGMVPGVVYVGFENDEVVPQGTLAAFFVLLAHVVLSITNTTINQLEPFRTGMEFLGTFVYFLGILIMASKYWSKKLYPIYNLLAIVSGCAALYLGSVYGMGMLLGVGGTFFYLYLLEKYYEIPWEGKGWAWSLLGLSIILYGMYAFSIKHPEYFLW